MKNGQIHLKPGYSSLSEMEYILRRSFSNTPNIERVFLFVGTHKIGTWIPGDKTVTTFADFAAENPQQSKFLPFAKQADKETLVAFELPFVITAVRERESPFKDKDGNTQYEIIYDVELDTTNPGFQFASRNKEISTAYALTLPSNLFRVNQMEKLIKPAIDEGKPMRARLTKIGKGYAFADAPVKKEQ